MRTATVRPARRARPLNLHGVWLTLAALAMAMKVLIPGGFMTAPRMADQPLSLVICTGEGAVAIAPGAVPPGDEEAAGGAHDKPCVFAGHGLGAPAPNLLEAVQVEFVAYIAAVVSAAASLAPGRGLAAPPPPARGPPSLLT